MTGSNRRSWHSSWHSSQVFGSPHRLSRDQLTTAQPTDLQDHAREMLRDLRELAHGFHPPVLGDNGLVAALESRVTRFTISVQILADDELRAERFPRMWRASRSWYLANLLPM